MTILDRMKKGGFKLLVERDGRLLFASDRSGIAPLYRGFVENPHLFEGADVADRVVGLAAALLLVNAKIRRVSAEVISKEAERALEDAGIERDGASRVKAISEPPPSPAAPEKGLEELAREAGTPAHFLELLRVRLG